MEQREPGVNTNESAEREESRETAPSSAATLVGVIAQTLDARAWPYCVVPGETIDRLCFGMRGPRENYDCVFTVCEHTRAASFMATHPAGLPLDRLGALCETIVRANDNLWLAAFQLNLEDARLSARAVVVVDGGALTVPMVDAMLDHVLTAWRWYGGAFMRVAYAEMAPLDAILEAELAGPARSAEAGDDG